MTNLLERVLEHEGFEEKPYPDPLSGAEPYTFGHGLTYITRAESEQIVKNRLDSFFKQLAGVHPWIEERPLDVQEVVTEMAFQMGMHGCLNFKNMWNAIMNRDYNRAADEMMDSKWAKQTKNRALNLSLIMRGCAG